MNQLKLKKIESGRYEMKDGKLSVSIYKYNNQWFVECKVGEYENEDGSLNFDYDEMTWTDDSKRECMNQAKIWMDNL